MSDDLPPKSLKPNPLRGLIERIADMTLLEQALWVLAGVFAIVALVVFIPTRLPQLSARLAPPTLLVQIVPTRSPSPIPTPSVTPTLMPTLLPTLSPLIMPTPPADGLSSKFAPNPDRTGWIGSKDLAPHWREVNLHSGVYQGQTFIGLIQFDLRSLAPGSKILYAALEMTGRGAVFLGETGEWKWELVDARATLNWGNESYDRIVQPPAVTTLGKPLAAQELAVGLTNRFVFTPEQLKLLEEQLEVGTINLRVRGPSEGADNLFTWEALAGSSGPTLYLVVVPAPFVVVTITPTAENVFAAATVLAQQTQSVKQFGTPPPSPRMANGNSAGAKRPMTL